MYHHFLKIYNCNPKTVQNIVSLTLSGILVLLTFGVTFGTALVAVGLSDEAAAGVSDISASSGLENYTIFAIFFAQRNPLSFCVLLGL